MHKNLLFLYLFFVLLSLKTEKASTQNRTRQKQNYILRQPPYLKTGDTVAIIATSGILKNKLGEIQLAKNLLNSWGLNVVVGEHVFSNNNHFAGTDNERYIDLQKALNDPKISAIWCARGGYGAVRILDKLDFSKYKKHPKWIIGFSDITVFHNKIHNEGFESIHAMMCVNLEENDLEIKKSISTLKNALFGKPLAYNFSGSRYNKLGSATGQLVGGNLTLLQTMLGSKTNINTSGKILFIEEVGEYKYHIDRMLQSLKRAGYFDNCKGVIIGGMSKLKKNSPDWGVSIEQLILDVIAEYNFPIAFNMPSGHEKENLALILGRTITLKVKNGRSTVIFK